MLASVVWADWVTNFQVESWKNNMEIISSLGHTLCISGLRVIKLNKIISMSLNFALARVTCEQYPARYIIHNVNY